MEIKFESRSFNVSLDDPFLIVSDFYYDNVPYKVSLYLDDPIYPHDFFVATVKDLTITFKSKEYLTGFVHDQIFILNGFLSESVESITFSFVKNLIPE